VKLFPLATIFLAALTGCSFDKAVTGPAACSLQYLDGKAPALPAKQAAKSKEICYSSYAAFHSGISRTPLWSAEFLSKDRVKAAREIERTSEFFAEPNVSAGERAELDDYRRSGYDRGHLAPSGDMPSQKAQQESFSLVNIVPQNGALNRGLWADLEQDVRSTIYRYGVGYIVTGPMFRGEKVNTLRGRVMVPTHIWKAVHIPGIGAVAIVATNNEPSHIEAMTIDQFSQKYGIDPFPSLSPALRSKKLRLSRG
jgi:endonuclease G